MGWTDTAVETVTADPAAVADLFPAAARHARAEGGDGEQARVALVCALSGPPEQVAALVEDLYRHGDGAEKRAVVAALNTCGTALLGERALPLVRDALRSNDTGLVGRAMGAYGARHLDDAGWRQGVVKCLFVGVPLETVHDLAGRADDELRRMVADLVAERSAAGRDTPADAAALLSGASS